MTELNNDLCLIRTWSDASEGEDIDGIRAIVKVQIGDVFAKSHVSLCFLHGQMRLARNSSASLSQLATSSVKSDTTLRMPHLETKAPTLAKKKLVPFFSAKKRNAWQGENGASFPEGEADILEGDFLQSPLRGERRSCSYG